MPVYGRNALQSELGGVYEDPGATVTGDTCKWGPDSSAVLHMLVARLGLAPPEGAWAGYLAQALRAVFVGDVSMPDPPAGIG
jgi:hypothetical protein